MGHKIVLQCLPDDISIKEVIDLFNKFGRITAVEFIGKTTISLQYEDLADAEDALKAKDGYDIRGNRIEISFVEENTNDCQEAER